MSKKILRCPECYSYGLTKECPCGATRVPPHPPKYSPEDKYLKYRVQYKKEKGLYVDS